MELVQHEPVSAESGCPAQRKTYHSNTPATPGYETDADGTWHIRNFALARQILRSTDTRQAGFLAETVGRSMSKVQPMLFKDGPEHHAQRRDTAKYFTPRITDTEYRAMMNRYADEIIDNLLASGTVDLATQTFELAVNVAGAIVGLTDSLLPGLPKRLENLFGAPMPSKMSPRAVANMLKANAAVFAFMQLDVMPAIRKRRRAPQDDLISHLVERGHSPLAILTECITFGAAGMVTTREFISACVWHFMENEPLRQRYLVAGEPERYAILREILRLEPVVAHLYRRTAAPIDLSLPDGESVTVPSGTLVDLHIYAINSDESTFGSCPAEINVERGLDKFTQYGMSFGDGAHSCPGAYVAIQESDIFLQKLLSLPNLRLVRRPDLGRDDEVVQGYEIRNLILSVN